MSLSITKFLHEFSKPNITPEESFGLLNDFQRSINLLIEQNNWKQKIIDRLQNETLNQKTYIERYNTTLVLLQQANEQNTQYRREFEYLKRNVPNETLAHQLDVQKASIDSSKADVVIIDDMQHSEVCKQVEKLTEELKRERTDNKALANKVKSLEEQYSLMASLHQNQTKTIKMYISQTNKIKELLNTITEVIEESNA